MCRECWVEYGCPKTLPENWEVISELIEQIYFEHPTGGYLHVVLDDYNVETPHIEGCLEDIHKNVDRLKESELELQRKCAELLLTISEEERIAVLALTEGFW